MKTALLSILAAATLLVSTPSFAAIPAVAGPFDNRHDDDRYNDRSSKDFNYGFDKKHKVTSSERARWEAAHRNDRRDDRNDRRDDRNDRRDDRNDRDFNYGFDKKTPRNAPGAGPLGGRPPLRRPTLGAANGK